MPIANDDLYAQSWNTNFGSNPFEDGRSEFTQDTEDAEYTPIQIPNENHPPFPGSPKNSGGSPVEQTTEPNDDHENEIPQHSSEDDQRTQKIQKESNISTVDNIQKTPQSSQNTPLQEEPINTRRKKDNLRPNPNPNYSDSSRY